MAIYPAFLDRLDNDEIMPSTMNNVFENNAFNNEHNNNDFDTIVSPSFSLPMNSFACKTDSSEDRPASTVETDFSDDDFVSDPYLNQSRSSLDLDKEVEALTMRAQRLFPDEDKDWAEFGWL